jgi:hypothetical protein
MKEAAMSNLDLWFFVAGLAVGELNGFLLVGWWFRRRMRALLGATSRN